MARSEGHPRGVTSTLPRRAGSRPETMAAIDAVTIEEVGQPLLLAS
jgi:hypothetical protein